MLGQVYTFTTVTLVTAVKYPEGDGSLDGRQGVAVNGTPGFERPLLLFRAVFFYVFIFGMMAGPRGERF